MGTASRYWRWIKIDATGKRKIEEIAAAKAFFYEQFPAVESSELSDVKIQRQLHQTWQSEAPDEMRYMAELCLRCLISSQIEQVCIQLETQFGSSHGFNRHDLFPLVLIDEVLLSKNKPQSAYRSLASEILQTFDPDRASLTTWTSRLTGQHPPLNQFLLEQGIYRISDWAILNDTRPQQLQGIFSDFEPLSPLSHLEICQASQLLEAYHAVYRRDRLQQTKARKKCQPPTPDQLHQIADYLRRNASSTPTPNRILSQLQTLAQQLRQYRIYARGGTVATASLDQPEISFKAQQIQAPLPDQNREQNEFLTFYRQQFLEGLDETIAQVTTDRLAAIKQAATAQHFLLALQLFHCQGRSMSEIAPLVNLAAQYQVTRLLKLKEYRATVRQQLLVNLRDRILEQAQAYANPTALHKLNQQLEAALDEQIATVVQQAETEVSTAKNHTPRSLFARRVCCHVDSRRIKP